MINIYLKHPHLIIEVIKSKFNKLHLWYLNRLRKRIAKYEFNCLTKNVYDPYYYTPITNIKFGIFTPILVVTKVIEEHFGFNTCMGLSIHGINVNTQLEDVVEVEITIHYPGRFIGKGGKDIYAIEERLEGIFLRRVNISIKEMRSDKNEPCRMF